MDRFSPVGPFASTTMANQQLVCERPTMPKPNSIGQAPPPWQFWEVGWVTSSAQPDQSALLNSTLSIVSIVELVALLLGDEGGQIENHRLVLSQQALVGEAKAGSRCRRRSGIGPDTTAIRTP